MTLPSARQLAALRTWRTWLLAVVGLLQGVQYVANPAYPLAAQAYAPLHSWGPGGWRAFGVALMVVGGWLALAFGGWEVLAHLAGTVLYAVLGAATLRAGFVPGVLVLPFGLHAGETAVWVWGRTTRPRPTGQRRGA